jgi:hypothetical protein
MKYSVPEEYQAQFNTLIRSVPLELQDDNEFKESVLVYLKMGGIGMARRYADTIAKYLNIDVLEIGTGLRFPKVVEVKQDGDDEEIEDEDDTDDDQEDEDKDEDRESDEKS